jgi:hypothetical protein
MAVKIFEEKRFKTIENERLFLDLERSITTDELHASQTSVQNSANSKRI